MQKQGFVQDKTSLGIEFGSTTIKLVLVDEQNQVLATGKHVWENRLQNGIWTYTLEDIYGGMQDAYQDLKASVQADYGIALTQMGAIGISAMMHGYVALDADDNLLVPFRTWRNTITEKESDILSDLFNFNIPQRWTVAHLYHAILNQEEHVSKISKVMTLATYVHYKLTGSYVVGIGEASGFFPIDSITKDYNQTMVDQFDALLQEQGVSFGLRDVFPKVLVAGDAAGSLTQAGAKLIDVDLKAGIPLCPPEGDAGTGMVATNSVTKSTGNVSAGTSIFAMLVLEKALSKMYREIDMVTTPQGYDVAMVHCNNCTSDLNAWGEMLSQFAKVIGVDIAPYKVLDKMFEVAKETGEDYSDLMSYNYVSGEPITGLADGRPVLMRTSDADFSFAKFSKATIYSALAALKIGMDILLIGEGVSINKLLGHGGFFKAAFGQEAMAAAANAPVSIMETAGEGGAFGIAVLASYMQNKGDLCFEDYLDQAVFKDSKILTVEPNPQEKEQFDLFLAKYIKALPTVQTATEVF